MDGLSLLLILLTLFLGVVSVVISWTEITRAVGFYHFNLLWILAGILGVFLSLDLFLFYFSWELMLVPMYFLISIWGRERRTYAAIKFFLFTQLSGLLMLSPSWPCTLPIIMRRALTPSSTRSCSVRRSVRMRPCGSCWASSSPSQ